MEKKMRIQFFNEDGSLVKDRLVTQDPEINVGPSESFKGVIRIETTLAESADVEKLYQYMLKLVGDLPLSHKASKKSKELDPMANTPREELVKAAIVAGKTQEKLLEFLRGYNFRFVSTQLLEDLGLDIGYGPKMRSRYQWMVRCIKFAKDPKNDKYDPTIGIGLKIYGEPSPKVMIYLEGKLYDKLSLEATNKHKVNRTQLEVAKFPKYMTYEEREKWRAEHRRIANQTEENPVAPSKFYLRWKPDVTLPEGYGVKK